MQHVNPSFNIQAPEIDFETAQLFVEAGPMGVSLAILGGDNCFKALVLYSFAAGQEETLPEQKLKEILGSEKLFQQQYFKTHICWSFPESILVPAALMDADRNLNMLNLVFGDSNPGTVKSDFLYRHDLFNVYRVTPVVVDIFSGYLPLATQMHVFTAMVNRDLPAGDHMFTVFYGNGLTIMLSKAGKLQVVQHFAYNNPDDCVFHLLNVCKGFEMDPGSVTVHINGMIDERSGLYAAIFKYFLNMEFDELPGEFTYDTAITDHPQHFFSHLFALAACV